MTFVCVTTGSRTPPVAKKYVPPGNRSAISQIDDDRDKAKSLCLLEPIVGHIPQAERIARGIDSNFYRAEALAAVATAAKGRHQERLITKALAAIQYDQTFAPYICRKVAAILPADNRVTLVEAARDQSRHTAELLAVLIPTLPNAMKRGCFRRKNEEGSFFCLAMSSCSGDGPADLDPTGISFH